MPDYLRDWTDVLSVMDGSRFKRERFIQKALKFGRHLKRVGGEIQTQRQFVEVLCTGKPEEFPEMMARFCMARLKRNDYSSWEGWQFRNEWATASYHPQIVERRWRGQEVPHVSILGEQGIGDEVMFASCIPEIKSEVTIECDPRLLGVFKRSFGCEAIPRSDIIDRKSSKYLFEPRDCYLPIGDLPKMFRRSVADFPRTAYLKPDPAFVEKWSHLKGRVGIAWRSRTGLVDPKSFKVENPVCLQYDAWDYETEGVEVPACDLHNDIEDLLGICANLERVVSVPQTIVHLAGSIGARVDVVMPKVGSSRVENQLPYRYGTPMVWYKDVHVHNAHR